MSLPATVYLIPGFMSPAWMMYPLAEYLDRLDDRPFNKVVRWDYPRVFGDLNVTIAKLADELDSHGERSVSIVSHSFGDWIVRSALNRVRTPSVVKLVSLCPVVTSVPIAKLVVKATGSLIPEFAIMASDDQAEVDVPSHLRIDRSSIWARGEALVRREEKIDPKSRERFVWASHNSVLFQPNAWRVIREELSSAFKQEL